MPQRIQRQRTLGWRMPDGAVVVSRPSKWGNPFMISPVVQAYPSLSSEQCASGTYAGQRHKPRRAYRCHECGWWHLTSMPQSDYVRQHGLTRSIAEAVGRRGWRDQRMADQP